MSAPLAGHPFQVGIVVADIGEALPRYRALHGLDDWLVVENGPQNLHGLHVRGKPAEFSMRLALAGAHPQLELLQPLTGDDPLRDWLDRNGEGLHHLAYEVESLDGAIAAMEAAGYECIQHGYLVEAIEPASA